MGLEYERAANNKRKMKDNGGVRAWRDFDNREGAEVREHIISPRMPGLLYKYARDMPILLKTPYCLSVSSRLCLAPYIDVSMERERKRERERDRFKYIYIYIHIHKGIYVCIYIDI